MTSRHSSPPKGGGLLPKIVKFNETFRNWYSRNKTHVVVGKGPVQIFPNLKAALKKFPKLFESFVGPMHDEVMEKGDWGRPWDAPKGSRLIGKDVMRFDTQESYDSLSRKAKRRKKKEERRKKKEKKS